MINENCFATLTICIPRAHVFHFAVVHVSTLMQSHAHSCCGYNKNQQKENIENAFYHDTKIRDKFI